MKGYLQDIGITKRLYQGFRANNRLTAFLVCLLISGICWIFTALNKFYTGQFVFTMQYKNLPFQKNINNDLPQKISVELEARGFDLISYSFRQRLDPIEVDVSAITGAMHSTRNTLSLPTRNLVSAEVSGLKEGMSVKHITPELITFDFSQRFRKKVPVIPQVTVTYAKQFYAPFRYIVKPDSVEIAGTQQDIAKITSVTTMPVEELALDRKKIVPVKLRSPGVQHIEMNPPKVWVYFPVEELAEEEIHVPVEMMNSADQNLLIIPDKVTITYQAPLNTIDRVNAEEFRVCGELQNGKDGPTMQARLRLCHIPAGVHQARISPMFARYLIAR